MDTQSKTLREIKFRAWDKDKGEMSDSFDLWNLACCNLYLFNDSDSPDSPFYPQKGKDVEVMQYTGLKDSKGKEIYEGDILGGSWGDGYIGYCDKCKNFEYIMELFGCSRCSGDCMWYELVEDDGKLEVIGNVYEHSHLLNTTVEK